MYKLKIIKPDDWHVHLRDGEILKHILCFTSSVVKRAVVMPNLDPPIDRIDAALRYKSKIVKFLPKKNKFLPLMTCNISTTNNILEIQKGYNTGVFFAGKLYLDSFDIKCKNDFLKITDILHILEKMEDIGMPLLIHGEIKNFNIDVFDQEKIFIDNVMIPLRTKFPYLKTVLEHISSETAVKYVLDNDNTLAATITPHHLFCNRNDFLFNRINPHLYCAPVLKRLKDQNALKEIATSGHPRFFIGTDSAPHTQPFKETNYGAAGIFNAPVALPVYATVFEEMNAIQNLELFCSVNGPRFYGMQPNKEKITLIKKEHVVPKYINVKNKKIVPFLAEKKLHWYVRS